MYITTYWFQNKKQSENKFSLIKYEPSCSAESHLFLIQEMFRTKIGIQLPRICFRFPEYLRVRGEGKYCKVALPPSPLCITNFSIRIFLNGRCEFFNVTRPYSPYEYIYISLFPCILYELDICASPCTSLYGWIHPDFFSQSILFSYPYFCDISWPPTKPALHARLDRQANEVRKCVRTNVFISLAGWPAVSDRQAT